MPRSQFRAVTWISLYLFVSCLSIDAVRADAFVWGEYAASNDLDPKASLSPNSWVARRCSRFKGEQTYPQKLKCSDGRDCLKNVPCSDGNPCICNDGKKDTEKHLGFTGDEEVFFFFFEATSKRTIVDIDSRSHPL
jgi:hypothetical protein